MYRILYTSETLTIRAIAQQKAGKIHCDFPDDDFVMCVCDGSEETHSLFQKIPGMTYCATCKDLSCPVARAHADGKL